MSRIFISYKRVDKEKVFKIKKQIESALGEKCWIDIDGIESDAQFMNVIIKAIRECEVLLFMYSKTHAQITDFEKDWTVRELNFASKKEKRIVFVNIDGSPLSDEFEFMYGTKQQVDATSDNAMTKLHTDLRVWLNITTHTKKLSNSMTSLKKSQDAQNKHLIFRIGNIEFKMIYVEGGTFTMGVAPKSEWYYNDETPTHDVTLSSFYIGETQVIQELWQIVMGYNPSYTKGYLNPVEQITWEECQKFIKKLNYYTGKEFRLPTEAEWEYAAHGGLKSNHTQYSGSNVLDEVAWYDKNRGPENHLTHPVKEKVPNELGIYDMSGNVCELCNDWYGEYSDHHQVNPQGPLEGTRRVFRLGSWANSQMDCRISCRRSIPADLKSNDRGFRLALSVE